MPERGSVYAIAEDHVNPNLLFAGTEFGLFFSINGGNNWVQIKSGLPTIAIRDIAIQKRENDLVLASFGRGFYILDDYACLRELNENIVDQKAELFPVKPALTYIESSPLGLRGVGSQGASMYAAPNPEFGATFTYYLKDVPMSPKDERQKAEKAAKEKGEDITYPTIEELIAEDNYQDPFLIFIVKDLEGNQVRKIESKPTKGMNRVVWNLRYPSTSPIQLKKAKTGRYSNPDEGPMALPGDYTVEMFMSENGKLSQLHEAVKFKVNQFENSSLTRDSDENLAFKKDLSELRRRFLGSSSEMSDLGERLSYLKKAVIDAPNADLAWMNEINVMETDERKIKIKMWGDHHRSGRDIETSPSTGGRIETIVYQAWYSTANVTSTQTEQLKIAKVEYADIRKNMDDLKFRIEAMEKRMNLKGIPYTPNRIDWKVD